MVNFWPWSKGQKLYGGGTSGFEGGQPTTCRLPKRIYKHQRQRICYCEPDQLNEDGAANSISESGIVKAENWYQTVTEN